MRTLMLLCLSIPVAACVTDGADDADNTEPSVSTTESALCGPSSSPPPYDYRYGFNPDGSITIIRSITDYGTTTCANYVVRLANPAQGNPGTMDVYMPTSTLPTTALGCVSTSLTVRTYKSSSAGLAIATTTNNAEWTASGCVMRTQIVGGQSSPYVEISAQRASYCPGGPLCAAAVYGLPVRLKIEDL
ncbi:MAG: hypothetical protein WKG01_00385 [Kofleriaceae bacterium]